MNYTTSIEFVEEYKEWKVEVTSEEGNTLYIGYWKDEWVAERDLDEVVTYLNRGWRM